MIRSRHEPTNLHCQTVDELQYPESSHWSPLRSISCWIRSQSKVRHLDISRCKLNIRLTEIYTLTNQSLRWKLPHIKGLSLIDSPTRSHLHLLQFTHSPSVTTVSHQMFIRIGDTSERPDSYQPFVINSTSNTRTIASGLRSTSTWSRNLLAKSKTKPRQISCIAIKSEGLFMPETISTEGYRRPSLQLSSMFKLKVGHHLHVCKSTAPTERCST